jgi:hypothetical protein
MKRRIVSFILLLSLLLISFSACAKGSNSFAGKTYLYTKFIGDVAFTITINEDNTFSYTPNPDGGYSYGTWEYANDILTLTEIYDDETTLVNNFRIEDGQIVFVAEGSDNFPSVRITNNDKFIDIDK